jgi:hypothetical protein
MAASEARLLGGAELLSRDPGLPLLLRLAVRATGGATRGVIRRCVRSDSPAKAGSAFSSVSPLLSTGSAKVVGGHGSGCGRIGRQPSGRRGVS